MTRPERPDYYAALGVARDADDLTIKRAFRRLAASHHPDRRPGDGLATVRFQALVEAYGVVGDPERRAAYDAGGSPAGPRIEPGAPLEEALGRVVDLLLGVRQRTPARGQDRQYRLALELPPAMLGAREILSVPADEPCETCDGRGFPLDHIPEVCGRCAGLGEVQRRRLLRAVVEACPDCDGRGFELQVPCGDCAGTGRRETRRAVTIDVPPGVVDGAVLKVRGAGAPGRNGGEPGDLLVRVQIAAHPVLRRRGADVEVTRPVSVFLALAGGWVEVPTLEGVRRVRLPPATRDGAVLRLAGLGARLEGGGRGDQRVLVQVELPSEVDADLADVLRSLDERLGREGFPETRAFDERWTNGHGGQGDGSG